MKEGDLFAKTPLVDRGVSTLPPASLPDRKRCDLSMNLYTPLQTLTLSWLVGWQVHPAMTTLRQS